MPALGAYGATLLAPAAATCSCARRTGSVVCNCFTQTGAALLLAGIRQLSCAPAGSQSLWQSHLRSAHLESLLWWSSSGACGRPLGPRLLLRLACRMSAVSQSDLLQAQRPGLLPVPQAHLPPWHLFGPCSALLSAAQSLHVPCTRRSDQRVLSLLCRGGSGYTYDRLSSGMLPSPSIQQALQLVG